MVLELLTTLMLTASANTNFIEPQRAADDLNFTIYNGTDKLMVASDDYNEIDYVIAQGTYTKIHYEYRPNDWTIWLDGNYADWTNTYWMEWLDSISTPQTPTWTYVQNVNRSYTTSLQTTSMGIGFGVYTTQYTDPNIDYYIDATKWGGINKGSNDWTGTNNTLTNGLETKITKEDRTQNILTNLMVARYNSNSKDPNYATIVYGVVNGQYVNIANNFGYAEYIMTSLPIPTEETQLQPYLLYYNDYTNKVNFTYQQLVKDAEMNPQTGYLQDSHELNTKQVGYLSYTPGGSEEAQTALSTGFMLAGLAFAVLEPLFGYMLFPGISIGLLLTIPLLMSLVFAIIKIIKKGG